MNYKMGMDLKGMFSYGLLVLVIFCYSGALLAQNLSGYTLDMETKQRIPFVNIMLEGTTIGTISDIDGYFELTPPAYPVHLVFHSLGYMDSTVVFIQSGVVKVALKEQALQLEEAVITEGENPAIAIVKKAISHRNENDPEKNESFTYRTYSKMVFGPELGDSHDDLILSDSSTSEDSASFRFSQSLKQHYFFITETVSERQFSPPSTSYEKVIANRFSGLKNPAFTMIATEFQPFSYYTDYVDIIGLKYLSPLARNSYKNYVFVLKDSIFDHSDTIYVIAFQPKKGKTFNGLKGVMSINTNKYAIQNIKVSQANPTSVMQIYVEQMSVFVADKQWFPVQFNTHIVMYNGEVSENEVGLNIFNAHGKTYVRDIVLGADVEKRKLPKVALELDARANKRDSVFWASHRKEPLSSKEIATYVKIDSLGEEFNFDQKLKIVEGLATGLLGIGPVSIELNKLLDYNQVEGTRVGMGIRSNDKISKWFSMGIYGAYGFKDKVWKYGGDLKLNLSSKNDMSLGVQYQYDVTPTAGVEFFKKEAFNFRSYSQLYLSKMDQVQGLSAYFTFRALGDFQNKIFYNNLEQSYTYPYVYTENQDTVLNNTNSFQRVELGWSFRFGYQEKYIRNFNKNISLGTKFPYVWMRYAHGNKELGGDFNYQKVDFKMSKIFLIKGFGKLGFQIDAGTTVGEVPLSFLSYGRGMKIDGLNLYIENAFNTMIPNEFVSQSYVSVFVHHGFGALYKKTYSAPAISLVTGAGWGDLPNPENHTGLTYSTMEKGYFESGLLIDNLIVVNTTGLGAGVFYRYGPYALPEMKANFGYNISFLYVFQ